MSVGAVEEALDRCLICDSRDWAPVREGSDLCRPKHPKIFKLARCLSCGHVMQIPVPDIQELDAAYSVSGDYACYRPAWGQKGWPVWKILRTWTTSRRIGWLKRYVTGKDLLEVGSGAGDFLVAAHRAGWKTCAVEYNPDMVDALRTNFKLDVRVGALAPNLWSPSSFDVVALWNVLEHLRNPLEEVSVAGSYLRPGGKMLFNIPSRQSAERGQSFGEDWALLDLPRHINFFDRHSLSLLCQKVGLELKEYKTPFIQSAWCYYMSCWNRARRKSDSFVRLALFSLSAAWVTLILPYMAFEAWYSRGLEAFAIAEKPKQNSN